MANKQNRYLTTKASEGKNIVNEIELRIIEVESDAVIVKFDGWRIRIYFDKKLDGSFHTNQLIKVKYTGNIKDVHSLRFHKLI